VKKYMATLGNSNQIIVGAAQLFVSRQGALEYDANLEEYVFGSGSVSGIPAFVPGERYADTVEGDANWRNVGYTMNGLELQFQPDFGEVQVDQLLDVAKLYKQGMQVNMVTAFAEATLENLLISVAGQDEDLDETDPTAIEFDLKSGELGSVPLERAMIAVGPGSGDPTAIGPDRVERVYVAARALSIDNVTVSAKRDEPSMFEVSFRLLPASNGSYGKIVDRVVGS
jgi:hypothetical protein